MLKSKQNLPGAQGQISLSLGLPKKIVASFDGGRISSDGGILLVRMADEKLELTELAASCLPENRRGDLIRHSALDMLRQRIYGIAHLYEDANDAKTLRFDDMHKLAVGRLPSDAPLASQPTLSRFENNVDDVSLKALQELLVHTFVRQHKKRKPAVVRLKMDTTCDETHGYQQMTFYNGCYETTCYVPLFIFAENGFPLASLLRPGNAAPGDGGLRMLKMIVHNLRLAWPGIPIEITADAAFALPEIYDWCEDNNVLYFISMKGNSALDYHTKEIVPLCKTYFDESSNTPTGELHNGKLSEEELYRTWRQKEERKRFASKNEGRMQEHFEQDTLVIRCFHEFQYSAKEWRTKRRLIAKIQYSSQGPDVRYVVTNSRQGSARAVYEKYCQRAQCENWIKDLKNYLRCDRTSCQEFDANQFRLLLHTFAYALLNVVKEAAGIVSATVETIRLRLLKIGVLIKEGSRNVRLSLASQHPAQDEFIRAWRALS